jgi:hypothetical protein
VYGRGFVASNRICCRYGSRAIVAAKVVNDAMILCNLTADVTGNGTIEVSNNGLDFSADGRLVMIATAMEIHSIQPSVAYSSLPQLVQVSVESLPSCSCHECCTSHSTWISCLLLGQIKATKNFI